MRFEWDESKAASNEAKRGISFEEAKQVFYDAHAVILVEDLIHIITAFEAGKREKRLYYEN